MTQVDFGKHSDDYAAYRPGPPGSLFRRLDVIAPLAGARCLDLATGPGTVALELAARGGTVVGIDIAQKQVETARRVAEERSLAERTRFEVARAESTGLEGSSFDLVTAGPASPERELPRPRARPSPGLVRPREKPL